MAPEIGNKYAEKWTKDKALALAELAYKTVSDKCYFISEVADKCDTYRDFFTYILKKFNDDEDVFRIIKKMQNKCEMIVTKKTADGDIVPSLGIFILKAYHGLTETSKQEITHKGQGLTINVGNDKAKEGLKDMIGETDKETR